MAELQIGHSFNTCEAHAKVTISILSHLYAVQSLTHYSYDLPADVFLDGEKRPARGKKAKTAPKNDEAAVNKRSFSTTGLDVGCRQARMRRPHGLQS